LRVLVEIEGNLPADSEEVLVVQVVEARVIGENSEFPVSWANTAGATQTSATIVSARMIEAAVRFMRPVPPDNVPPALTGTCSGKAWLRLHQGRQQVGLQGR
jgi:hypothetical protein